MSKNKGRLGVDQQEHSPVLSQELKSRYIHLLKSGRRAELLVHLKEGLYRQNMYLQALPLNEAGKLVRARSDYMDQLISLFYQLGATPPAAGSDNNQASMAVVAVGGYGRRELCPCSDIDLLFLYEDKIDKMVETPVNEVLYFLWDLALQVGHSCRSAKKSLQLAETDLTVCTALIESRFIAGNKQIYERFFATLLDRIRKQGDAFIREKIREQKERHARYDHSVNLLEPNVKESPGGLRDYHLCLWSAIVLHGPLVFDDLLALEILSDEELKSLNESVNFLLKVRNRLHFHCFRRCDTLAMDYQDKIAEELGYKNKKAQTASQQLMQDYYIHGNLIRYLSHIFLQHCINDDSKSKGKRPLANLRTIYIEEGFSILDGELILPEKKRNPFQENPSSMISAFEWCGRYNLALSNDVKRLIRSNLPLVDDNFRRSAKTKDIFLSILRCKNAADVLRQMHEVHFLGCYIPEFEPLNCLAQRDLYHQFTLDEHTLMAIHHLEGLLSNADGNLSELAHIYSGLNCPEIVKLALLLHDLGKGEGKDHHAGSVKISKNIFGRMNLNKQSRKIILFLVENHLEMSHLAQHHDLDDTHIIRSFADLVGSVENLRMLYLVSYADIRSVGHEVWNAWKGYLLSDLYNRTSNLLQKKVPQNLKRNVLQSLPREITPREVEIYFDSLPPRLRDFLSAEKIIKHLKLIAGQGSKLVQITHNRDISGNFTELMVCTVNRYGVLAQITGVLASCNINILGAQVNTLNNGIAIDTLQITDIQDKPITDETVLKKLETELTLVLEGKGDLDSARLSGRRFFVPKKEAALPIATRISLDNAFSPHYSVIQLVCRDRLGLLYLITSSLFRMGIEVSMAKITTEAHRAIDTFYAMERNGEKILDETRQEMIKKTLKKIIDQSNRPA